MKSKGLLFIGIILLVSGIVLKKSTQMNALGLTLIITGVTLKSIYILSKVRSGEYKPGREVIFLIVGLILFFTGLYLRNINQALIKPIYLIGVGITFKIIFIIRFIQIVKSKKK
jgi:hypothetical protein